MKISEIISKPVLNLYSGKMEGTIGNVLFDSSYKKLVYLKMFDEDEEEFLIPTNKIYALGQAVVIKNNQALILSLNKLDTKENNIVNKNVYTILGENYEKVVDAQLNDKLEVENFSTSSKTFSSKDILNVTENVIINTTDKKVKLQNIKPRILAKLNTENKVEILPFIDTTKIQQELEKPTEKKLNYKISSQFTPQKLTGNSDLLIGRKAQKTIYGLNNEIIIKKDSLINQKILDNAKKHNKLVELTIFSKVKA